MFFFGNSLKTKSHTGESADKCKSCSKVFSCSKSLEVHLVTRAGHPVQSLNQLSLFLFEICNSSVKSESAFPGHVQGDQLGRFFAKNGKDGFPWPSFLDQKNLAREAQKCHLLGSVSLKVKNQ